MHSCGRLENRVWHPTLWRKEMQRLTRYSPFALLALAVLLFTAGCKSNPNQNAADTGSSQPAATDSSSDPASANLAPVATAPAQTSAPTTSAPTAASSSTSSDQSTQSTASTTDTSASVANLPTATDDDTSYGQAPVATAPEPPPPLPDYQQPAAPGDDYLWTPGYWNYASAGYYWVPGVWVQAPYQGALWTPGYWGIVHGRYGFFHGYWGPHIGFYGGVNYGFGYIGTGYQGGYWRTGHFFYNRSVNNINVTVVHNVYDYRVVTNNNVRISYNGGRGGLEVRARPAELVAAFREPHAPPMRTQIEVQTSASTNRANFISENHGRPAAAVIEKPIVADRDVRPVPPPARYQAPQQRQVMEAHPNAAPPQRNNEPARPEARPATPQRNEPARPETRPNVAAPQHSEPARPAERPAPRTEATPRPEPHPQASQPRPEEHPAPRAAPAKPAAHPPAKPEPPKKEDEHPR